MNSGSAMHSHASTGELLSSAAMNFLLESLRAVDSIVRLNRTGDRLNDRIKLHGRLLRRAPDLIYGHRNFLNDGRTAGKRTSNSRLVVE